MAHSHIQMVAGLALAVLAIPTGGHAQENAEARIKALEEKVAYLTALLEQRAAPVERSPPPPVAPIAPSDREVR